MKNILSPSSRQVLAQVAWSNVVLGFDYDGTLAPIVDDPEKARMRESTRDLLEQVARKYPCVIISGRAQDDVARRIRGVGAFEVIGNHGLEPWRRTEPFAARVHEWVATLQRELASAPGVVVEDKVFSVAVHYRRAPRRKEARRQIVDAVAKLDRVRVIGGKCVVNVIPHGAPHKGTALELARDQLGCDVALYVGDDKTDEDVFALDDPGRLVTVRVGQSATSRAAFYVPDQASVDALLERLLALRDDLKQAAR
jgi:trehalose 6-phosphate phosphatase